MGPLDSEPGASYAGGLERGPGLPARSKKQGDPRWPTASSMESGGPHGPHSVHWSVPINSSEGKGGSGEGACPELVSPQSQK